MNQNELKAALAAMLYGAQEASAGPNPNVLPSNYLGSYGREWKQFLKSREWAAIEATATSRPEALLLAVQAFDAFVCRAVAKCEQPAVAALPLYLGVRRLLQRALGAGEFFIKFREARGTIIYESDEMGFGSQHSLVMAPVQGTVAEGLKAAGLPRGLWFNFPNVRVGVDPSDTEELVELSIRTRINVPLGPSVRASVLCENARRSTAMHHYSGNYL